MKRRLVKLVVFLLLGAIVNVAVAWGCFIGFDANNCSIRAMEQKSAESVGNRYATSGLGHISAIRGSLFTCRGNNGYLIDAVHAGSYGWKTVWVLESGWPCRSFDQVRIVGSPISKQTLVRGWQSSSGVVAPLPLWPGFAINTVFYAVILWVLWWGGFVAPFALRRRLRIRRGLCPACAYDLRGSVGGSQTCPECGATR